MGKHSRKRQKKEKDAVEPLGGRTSVDDADKDDEERRLESTLFGVPYRVAASGRQPGDHHHAVISDVQDDVAGLGGHSKELENMLDSDLFFIDSNVGPPSTSNDGHESDNDPDVQPPVRDEQEEEVEVEEGEDGDEAADEQTPDDLATTEHDRETSVRNTLAPKTRRTSAWVDPDDAGIQVSLTSHTRLRKLRDAPAEDIVGGREYERKLRRQYERINPAPEWASRARRKLRPKRRRPSASSESEPEEPEEPESGGLEDVIIPDLLTSTGGISGGKKSRSLTQGVISVDRLRDANQAAPAEGEVTSVQFHPSPQVPVLLTASTDRRLRLFHVDGLTNPHAQTLHVPSLPLKNAVFHPSGSSVLLTGPRPFYYTYDLQSGTSHRSPRGLWGTTFSANHQDGSMDVCAFSPSGDVLAVAGRRGHIHLVDWRSGSAQVVAGLKANAGIRSLWWSRGSKGPGEQLLSLTEDSQVYVWDVGQRRCVKRWQDEGGFGSRIVKGDHRGDYIAIGSNTGLVNVYSANSAVETETTSKPKPLKTLGNLTTNISCLSYNHDSQLLAMASNVKKDQMRMVHLPSLTAFGNWPTSSTPLGHVTAIDFSNASEYLVIGNNRGRALLYQLRHYVEQ